MVLVSGETGQPTYIAKPINGELITKQRREEIHERRKWDLVSAIGRANLAEDLEEDDLNRIGETVWREYDIDKQSRSDWERQAEEARNLFKLIARAKTFPWANASNVIYPMVAQAALNFHSRAYPNLIKDRQVVKGKVIGDDPMGEKAARAQRCGEAMSYYILEKMDSWESEMDILLLDYAIVGTAFKKTWFNPRLNKVVSDWVKAEDLVVHYACRDLSRAPRITHVYELFFNEIVELIRSGAFLDVELGDPDNTDQQDPGDENRPYTILEQHRWLDLDGDGYEEPYIVTIETESHKVLRIKARYDENGIEMGEKGRLIRIQPLEYFTWFPFIPCDSVYAIGYGLLLGHSNRTINALINQVIDAGTLQNAGGGFYRAGAVDFDGGRRRQIEFKLGEYKPLQIAGGDDINKVLWERRSQGPSPVLFNALELMIGSSEKLANITEVLMGSSPGANASPTTTVALIEQGLQQFSAIYARLHRALKAEFAKIRRLIVKNQQDFSKFERANGFYEDIIPGDLDEDGMIDVIPVSDPQSVTNVQRMMKAELGAKLIGTGLNDTELKRRYLEAANIENIEKILPPEDAPPPIDPKIEIEKAKLELENKRVTMEEHRMAMDLAESKTRIMEMRARSLKAIADAEAAEAGTQIDEYRNQLMQTERILDLLNQLEEAKGNDGTPSGPVAGALAGVAGAPGDAGVPANPGGPGPEPPGGVGPGGQPGPGPGGADAGVDGAVGGLR